MRKVLLGTTALAAVGLAAGSASAQWDVSVGGFMNQWFGYGQNSSQYSLQSFDQWSNTEIFFLGTNTLDNGITFGFNVQLEGNTQGQGATVNGDTIDESFLFVSSPEYGRLQLGSENSAAYTMHTAAPNVGLPINSGSQTQHVGNFTGGALFRSAFGSTFLEPAGDNDGQKITYFTPRFSGFQLGVSYLPDVDAGGGDINGLTATNVVGNYNQGLSVGANFVDSFGPVDVQVSGGFFWAEGVNSSGTVIDTFGTGGTGGIARGLGHDFLAWSTGASVAWQGFTVGGSYARIEQGRITADVAVPAGTATGAFGIESTEGDGWDVGISYEQGPWGFSFTYFQGVEEGVQNIPDNRFHQSMVGNVAYALAPGVALIGAVGWSEFQAEADPRLGAVGGGPGTFDFAFGGERGGARSGNSGVFATTGIALSF